MGENTLAWPSFENLSAAFADHVRTRQRAVNQAAAIIQGAWRGERNGRGRMWSITAKLQHDLLGHQVWAHEKLDGTNFGVTCEGVRVGRRRVVAPETKTYQTVTIDGAAPSKEQVLAVKHALAKAAGVTLVGLPTFVLYGELMCNPTKFAYHERLKGVKFAAFGGKFAAGDEGAESKETAAFVAGLRAAGIAHVYDFQQGRITIIASPAFTAIAQGCGLATVPLVGEGPLRDVLPALYPRLMENNSEGVVLTGLGGYLKKWKTGAEDESAGEGHLRKIQEEVEEGVASLCYAVTDEHCVILKLLHTICINRGKRILKSKGAKQPKDTDKDASAMNKDAFDQAMASAKSKYDALEAYFESGDTRFIKEKLLEEVNADLNPPGPAEEKAIKKAVGAHVSAAFKAWAKAKAEREA